MINYNAILEKFSSFSDGLTGLLDDSVGIVFNGASEVVFVPNLHSLAHRRPEPSHFIHFHRKFEGSKGEFGGCSSNFTRRRSSRDGGGGVVVRTKIGRIEAVNGGFASARFKIKTLTF